MLQLEYTEEHAHHNFRNDVGTHKKIGSREIRQHLLDWKLEPPQDVLGSRTPLREYKQPFPVL